jgi:FkbM family methyltransferase
MHKLKTFVRYFKDFLQYGQIRLVLASVFYILTGKSFIETRIFRGKLGFFLHRRGTLDFQFGNYAYEWNVKTIFNQHYKHYNVFIDVGANIGTYTIMLAGKGLRTYSFEPAYENFKALNINILLNNLEKNSTTYNLGLNNENTKAAFAFDPLNTGASHIGTVQAETEEAEKRSITTEIQLIRLDEMMDKMNLDEKDRILMKIDVEGMEAEVLEGAENFIKNSHELFIVMESVHSGEEKLKSILNRFAVFEYFPVDALNFAARKIQNLNNK